MSHPRKRGSLPRRNPSRIVTEKTARRLVHDLCRDLDRATMRMRRLPIVKGMVSTDELFPLQRRLKQFADATFVSWERVQPKVEDGVPIIGCHAQAASDGA